MHLVTVLCAVCFIVHQYSVHMPLPRHIQPTILQFYFHSVNSSNEV